MLEASGLVAGVDFHLAFSPERIDPGNATFGLRNTPKVVGGYTADCTDRAAAFYAAVRRRRRRAPWHPRGRDGQAAREHLPARQHRPGQRDGEVLPRARHRPVGRHRAALPPSRSASRRSIPGPGVGGHCIPIDPNYLATTCAPLGYPFRFVELAQEINAPMPAYVAHRARTAQHGPEADQRRDVLLLGVTYKPDIADQRESPAIPLAKQLAARGASVAFHDPYLETWQPTGDVRKRVDDLDTSLMEADLTILLQGHSSYDVEQLATKARRLLDTRGVVPAAPSVEHL